MAKVKYKPEPGASDSTEQFGYRFEGGKAVDVTDETHLKKFAGNPFFEVAGDKDQHTQKDHEEAQKEANQPPTADRDDKAGNTPRTSGEPLRAVHRGRGTYSIVRGDADEEVSEGLSKAEADAFNAMTDADKAAELDRRNAAKK